MSTWIWLASSLLPLGCGELVDGSWRGEELALLQGNVVVQEGYEQRDSALRVGLFWANGAALYEQDVATELEFPAFYTLSVFSPPPPEALREVPQTAGEVAIGTPLLYLDSDGDQRLDVGVEAIVGATVEVALVYNLEPLEVVSSWSMDGQDMPQVAGTTLLDPGFHTLASDAALCELSTWMPYEQVAVDQADILVGTYADELVDVDCDSERDEWWEDGDHGGNDDSGGMGGGMSGEDESEDESEDEGEDSGED